MSKVTLAPSSRLAALAWKPHRTRERMRWAERIQKDKYDGRHVQDIKVRRETRRLAHRFRVTRSA
jgi:hypothetical protein